MWKRLAIATVLLATPLHAATYTHPADHYTITYPDAWHLYPDYPESPLVRDSLIMLLTCNRSDLVQNMVPDGAARIAIRQMSPESAMDELDYARRVQESDKTATVNPTPPLRITRIWKTYATNDADDKNVQVYLKRHGRLILFDLTYAVTDPRAMEYESVLDSIVSSLNYPD